MKKLFVLLTISLLAVKTQAQSKVTTENKIVVYYPFEGIKSTNEVALLDNEIKQLINVVDSKTEYKAGKTNGQLRVWVSYPSNPREGDELFTAVLLKKLLIKKGYVPQQPRQTSALATSN